MARITPEKTRHDKRSPKAEAWDKLSAQEVDETLAHRDVFTNQQVDRSRISALESKTWRTSVAITVGVLTASLIWFAYSLATWGIEFVGRFTSGRSQADNSLVTQLLGFGFWKVLATVLITGAVGGGVHLLLMRNLAAQNLLNDVTDINQYDGDQHIAMPEEIVRRFDWFPDVGAHSDVQVSSLISHVMMSNKGLKRVNMLKRAQADILDGDGEVAYLEGEVLYDEAGEPLAEQLPMIDEAFGEELFDASKLPKDRKLRRRFDATQIPYNPDNADRDKQQGHARVADLVNADWEIPDYEVQRPAGAYLVDTAPVNTMVLAITRAGKGQTCIEPTIDMWLREKRPNNMVINDPKGELLVKNYVRATLRGFEVVQFNLINALKTDIYNPLGMAAEAAREGDVIKCAQYVENIADVFFPLDSGDDPFWANAANNAFKRVAYGLIDFYMEEERRLRLEAAANDTNSKVLETQIDELWGKVTLYNCYQLFVQLTSKKQKSPLSALEAKLKAGEYGSREMETFEEDRYFHDLEEADKREFLWRGLPEMDMLSLYFSATETLPTNTIRTLIANADNSLKAMGGSEKTIMTVYGIAITAMSFFTDPTIMRLTSGAPSQNTDLGGLSFPRRIGVRFDPNYVTKEHLVGTQAKWEAFADDSFVTSLGEDFLHEDTVSPEGWARYYFVGKFPNQTAYLRLSVHNAQTGLLIKTFHFQFTKDFQTSLSGRYYITDPVTGEKLIKNGVLEELRRPETTSTTRFVPGHTTFKQTRLTAKDGQAEAVRVLDESRAIMQTMVRYSEKPKAVFLVTPPHLMKYAKLLLILIKQLVDLNFDKSYMTKSNQKPLYKTRFMLDELGNLQSEGHGISGFETMLSIGLGQEQQFTIILQTLQQLRDVYGESVDKIVQGNTSNIVFLKSTDDSMIDTLQKMSGTRHVVRRNSKTVTKDVEKVLTFSAVEGKVSYTMTTTEEPVITYNDMAFIAERNSILFRAGDAPVWNRNETILPMSWRLFQDTIQHPGHDYTLQTIPTLSSAADYDVRRNQPDFFKMLASRVEQAVQATDAKDKYRRAFGYTDSDIARLDPDLYADAVMELVNEVLHEAAAVDEGFAAFDDIPGVWGDPYGEYEDNVELQQEMAVAAAQLVEVQRKRYAGGWLSREDLTPALDSVVINAYMQCHAEMQRSTGYFSPGADGGLRSKDGRVAYIAETDDQQTIDSLRQQASESGNVYSEPDAVDQVGGSPHNSLRVTREFYSFLGSLASWQDIANGEFERLMGAFMQAQEDASLDD